MFKQCEGRIWPRGGMHRYPCSNAGKVERDGKWEAVRNVLEAARGEAERKRNIRNAKADMFDELTTALRMYQSAGIGNSTDYQQQAEAYNAAKAALKKAEGI